jgi:hypothetical protein
MLELPEVSARRIGPNTAAEILDMIKSYQIQDKIGYFTLDNTKSNGTTMETISRGSASLRPAGEGAVLGIL